MLIIFYMFAVVAVQCFGKNDPAHFGDIGISMLTLFRSRCTHTHTRPSMLVRAHTQCARTPTCTTHANRTCSKITAFLLLFLNSCATLEDWTDVMYINMYGCDDYDSGLYVHSNNTKAGLVKTDFGWFYK